MAGEGGLWAEGLARAYGARRVVDHLSLEVAPGEVVGRLGPNGAGKSTTFKMIMGAVRPDTGRVWLDGQELTHLPLHRRARLGLGYLAQEPSVFRGLSVEDNLRAVLELRPDRSRGAREARARALLAEFELERVRFNRAEQLSGGERRRLEIARCLAMDPRLILLDEPFSGIDPMAVADLQKQLLRLQARGLGLLITDHNVRETLKICRRAYVIVEGRIIAEGTRQEVAEDEQVRRVYLGADFVLS